MLNFTNNKIIYSVLFFVGKIVFMHTQSPDKKCGPFV